MIVLHFSILKMIGQRKSNYFQGSQIKQAPSHSDTTERVSLKDVCSTASTLNILVTDYHQRNGCELFRPFQNLHYQCEHRKLLHKTPLALLFYWWHFLSILFPFRCLRRGPVCWTEKRMHISTVELLKEEATCFLKALEALRSCTKGADNIGW